MISTALRAGKGMGGWSTISDDEFTRVKTLAEAARNACEDHDPVTFHHSVRVAHWSVLLASRLVGFGVSRLRRLEITAMLHDYGKTYVNPKVLTKGGPLDEAEWAEMKRHPELGITHLPVPLEYVAPEGIRWHHKYYNGGGYPEGDIKGVDLPLEARLISVADVFDALTSRRPYRAEKPAFSPSEALLVMRNMAGRQLDPALVSMFDAVYLAECERVGGQAGAQTLQLMSILGLEIQRARDLLKKIIGPFDLHNPLRGRPAEPVLGELIAKLERTNLDRESAENIARSVLRMPLIETFTPDALEPVRGPAGPTGAMVGHHFEVQLSLRNRERDPSYLKVVVYKGRLWLCISENTDDAIEVRLAR